MRLLRALASHPLTPRLVGFLEGIFLLGHRDLWTDEAFVLRACREPWSALGSLLQGDPYHPLPLLLQKSWCTFSGGTDSLPLLSLGLLFLALFLAEQHLVQGTPLVRWILWTSFPIWFFGGMRRYYALGALLAVLGLISRRGIGQLLLAVAGWFTTPPLGLWLLAPRLRWEAPRLLAGLLAGGLYLAYISRITDFRGTPNWLLFPQHLASFAYQFLLGDVFPGFLPVIALLLLAGTALLNEHSSRSALTIPSLAWTVLLAALGAGLLPVGPDFFPSRVFFLLFVLHIALARGFAAWQRLFRTGNIWAAGWLLAQLSVVLLSPWSPGYVTSAFRTPWREMIRYARQRTPSDTLWVAHDEAFLHVARSFGISEDRILLLPPLTTAEAQERLTELIPSAVVWMGNPRLGVLYGWEPLERWLQLVYAPADRRAFLIDPPALTALKRRLGRETDRVKALVVIYRLAGVLSASDAENPY